MIGLCASNVYSSLRRLITSFDKLTESSRMGITSRSLIRRPGKKPIPVLLKDKSVVGGVTSFRFLTRLLRLSAALGANDTHLTPRGYLTKCKQSIK